MPLVAEIDLDWSHKKYIAITISGLLVKSELLPVMAEILQHPDYLIKHTLWDLRQTDSGLSMGDLKEIAGVMKLYKPRTPNFADRSALLVPGRMNSAMAEVFVAMTKLLPVKYRVFRDQAEAEAYLLS